MEQYEPLDLTTPLDILSSEKVDEDCHVRNAQARHRPLHQTSFPESRPVNIVNIVNGHSRHTYMPSTHGPGRNSVSRRVALVQPQRGQNTKARGKDNHTECTPKALKPQALEPPSLQKPLPAEDDMASQQLPDIAVLQANTLPGAESVDNQTILILTPQQTMPMATSQYSTHLSSLHNGTVMQSTLQNINIQNVTQFPSCLISSGHQDIDVSAPDHVLAAAAANVHAIPISHLINQTNVSPFSFGQVGHNAAEKFQVPIPQMLGDRSNRQISNGRQMPMSADNQIQGFGDINLNTVQDMTENYNHQLQVINVRSLRDSNSEVHEYKSHVERQRHHQAKEKNIRNVKHTVSSNVMQGQIEARIQAVGHEMKSLNNLMVTSTKNVHISAKTCHSIHGQHINPNEQTAFSTHQRPSTHDQLYPIVNALLDNDADVPLAVASGQPQVQSGPDRPAPQNMQPCNMPQKQLNHETNQNGYISYRKGSMQDKRGKHDSRCEGNTHEAVKRKKMEMFQLLDKKEKTALLREKYAELLKRRRQQLHTFDPRYKISLRKMNHTSRELQTLSVMTKLNCPPRLKSIVKSTQFLSKRNKHPGSKSRSTSSSTLDVGNKNPIVIDLTGDPPSPIQEDKEQRDEEMDHPSRILASRLPSYEEALAAKEESPQDKFNVDEMSSVARRLLSSSQEFLKNYQSPAKPLTSGEALHSENKSMDEHSAGNTKATALDSPDDPLETHPKTQEATECSQDYVTVEIFPINQEHQSASEALELSTPIVASAEVFSKTTDIHSWPAVDSSPTYILQQKDISVPSFSDTSTMNIAANNESMTSSEPVMRQNSSVHDDETWSSLSPTGVPDRKPEVPHDLSTKKDSAMIQMDTVYLGSEKHTLKNAIVRIQDIRKKSRKQVTEDISGARKEPCLDIKRRHRRRRRSNNDLPTKRKRKRSSTPTGTTRSRCPSPASHYAFQDFVPTILPSRTRATTSGHITSCQTLAMELLQYDLDDAINDGTEIERDVDNYLDEDYSPHIKHVRRHQIKRKKSNSDIPSCGESDTASAIPPSKTASGSVQSNSESSPGSYQPLRVEIGKNSQNHIRLKFVNIRSIQDGAYDEGNPTSPLSHRKHKRSQKTKRVKSKHKDKTTVAGPEEQLKVDTRFPCEEGQNATRVNGSAEADTTNNEINSANVCDASPDLPPGMKKLIINKKVGETLLHRAAKLGNMEILRYCIEYNMVDVNARDKAGYTSLHDSCVPGHVHVAEFLLKHGADVNSEAYDGTRPIHDAVENNHVDLVRLLLFHGADPFLPTATGRTSVQQALDRSSEMRSLILGFLEDMKVGKHNLGDERVDSPCLWNNNGT